MTSVPLPRSRAGRPGARVVLLVLVLTLAPLLVACGGYQPVVEPTAEAELETATDPKNGLNPLPEDGGDAAGADQAGAADADQAGAADRAGAADQAADPAGQAAGAGAAQGGRTGSAADGRVSALEVCVALRDGLKVITAQEPEGAKVALSLALTTVYQDQKALRTLDGARVDRLTAAQCPNISARALKAAGVRNFAQLT